MSGFATSALKARKPRHGGEPSGKQRRDWSVGQQMFLHERCRSMSQENCDYHSHRGRQDPTNVYACGIEP